MAVPKGAPGIPLLLSILPAAVLLALAAVTGGCERPTVQVARARIGAVERTATSVEAGVVRAKKDSILSVPTSGRIVEVFKVRGDRVKAKEPLIRLENDLERIALDEARVDLERLTTLNPSGAASKELLDRARFNLDRAQVHYERTFVRAPFDGILIELNANIGEMSYGTMPLNLVLGGKKGNAEDSLARVIDDSLIYVEADFDEADSGRLRLCQRARITVDALNGRVLEGKVSFISQTISTAEGKSRTVRAEIDVDGSGGVPGSGGGAPDPGLRVGMSADVEVILDRAEDVVSVPTLVILEEEMGKTVFVVEEGLLRRRLVKIGVANWELTEIVEGVRPGEAVVIPTDRRKLIDGLEVRVEAREDLP